MTLQKCKVCVCAGTIRINNYIFAVVLEGQPFRNISKITLRSEAAIKIYFSISLFSLVEKLFKNTFDGVQFLVNLPITLSNFEVLVWMFKYFVTVLVNEQLLL